MKAVVMRKKHRYIAFFVSVILLSQIFLSCISSDVPASNGSGQIEVESSMEKTEPDSGPEQPESVQEVEAPVSKYQISEDPQELAFITSRGTPLQGRFYAANKASAPLVILFHWAPGDQDDWAAIAPWLQNRGLVTSPANANVPWLNAFWFPPLPGEMSFNVFTFTFYGCENGCKSFDVETRKNWYEDVQGAVDYAIGLIGVDAERVIMIGASIGADGAVDGCAYLNKISPGSCLGALSFSPGNYLTIDYAEKVNELDPVPVWCLYTEVDPESAPICGSIDETNYSGIAYPAAMIFSNGHGMNLVEGHYDPNPLTLIIQFLEQVM